MTDEVMALRGLMEKKAPTGISARDNRLRRPSADGAGRCRADWGSVRREEHRAAGCNATATAHDWEASAGALSPHPRAPPGAASSQVSWSRVGWRKMRWRR